MSRRDLAVRILKHVRHCALKNADATATAFFPAVKPRSVFTKRIAAASGLYTNQPHSFICDERMKQANRIRAATDACNQRARQFPRRRQNLFARFASDHALEIAYHQGVRMRSKRTAQQVVSVVDI